MATSFGAMSSVAGVNFWDNLSSCANFPWVAEDEDRPPRTNPALSTVYYYLSSTIFLVATKSLASSR